MVVLSLGLILILSSQEKPKSDTTTVVREADTLYLEQTLHQMKLDSIIDEKRKE